MRLLKNNKKAFNLVEVLITLGVIGVVAAMTLPSVITNYQKHATVASLKKGYSMLQQVVLKSQEDNGNISEWYSSSSSIDEYVDKYFAPYMQIVSKKNKSRNNIKTLSQYFGYGSGFLWDFDWYYLKNGMCFAIYVYPSDNNYFLFLDINGDKNPNAIGRDIFVFDIKHYQNVEFYKANRDNWYKDERLVNNLYSKNDSNYACNPERVGYFSGMTCGAVIQLEGWTISNRYPWK